jgi:hypothetical protein
MLVESRTFEPQEKGGDDRGRSRQQIVQDNQDLTRRKSRHFHVASFRVEFFRLPAERRRANISETEASAISARTSMLSTRHSHF